MLTLAVLHLFSSRRWPRALRCPNIRRGFSPILWDSFFSGCQRCSRILPPVQRPNLLTKLRLENLTTCRHPFLMGDSLRFFGMPQGSQDSLRFSEKQIAHKVMKRDSCGGVKSIPFSSRILKDSLGFSGSETILHAVRTRNRDIEASGSCRGFSRILWDSLQDSCEK